MKTPLQFGHWNAARTVRFIKPHTNTGLELVFVQNGDVVWDYEGTHIHVPSGNLSYSWPWQVHAARGERLPLVEISWLILPLQNAGRLRTRSAKSPRFTQNLECTETKKLIRALLTLETPVLKMRAPFRSYFARLINQLEQTQGVLDIEASGWLHLCLAEIYRSAQSANGDASQHAERDQVRHFLENTLPVQASQKWTLGSMAAACGMGRTVFAERVKQISGDTPIRTLARCRVDRAKSMLREAKLPITEIAFDCGFGSSQHFATVFRAYTGHTPSTFRRTARRLKPAG